MIAGAVRTLRIASHTLALRMCQECRAVVSALCDGTNPLRVRHRARRGVGHDAIEVTQLRQRAGVATNCSAHAISTRNGTRLNGRLIAID